MYSAANPQSGTTYTWGATNGDLSNTIGTQTSINWFNVGDGTVTLTATSANGCSSLPTTENVSIGTSPTAAFTFNPPAGFGTDYFQFTDQSQGANTWNWTFGNTGNSDVQNPGHTFNFSDNHIVVLVVTSEDGCTDTTFAIVPIIEGFEIPNVFTPNGDGVNDVFQISGSGFNTYKCQIFNRWGNLVFESSAPQISWDGKTLAGVKAPSGVYFVILEVDTPTEPIKYNGTLTLLDPQ
jgi:gliding motility-associated-like protein